MKVGSRSGMWPSGWVLIAAGILFAAGLAIHSEPLLSTRGGCFDLTASIPAGTPNTDNIPVFNESYWDTQNGIQGPPELHYGVYVASSYESGCGHVYALPFHCDYVTGVYTTGLHLFVSQGWPWSPNGTVWTPGPAGNYTAILFDGTGAATATFDSAFAEPHHNSVVEWVDSISTGWTRGQGAVVETGDVILLFSQQSLEGYTLLVALGEYNNGAEDALVL